MRKLAIVLASLPLLAAGSALAQSAALPEDEEALTPRERALSRQPDLNPDWTWMNEVQAILLLKAVGYSDVLSLERYGAFWRGKAKSGDASFQVAINRYAEVIGHMDHKSLIAATERKERANPTAKTMLATLNGPVAVPASQSAPTTLTRGRPVATVMGEVGWTWMREDQAVKILASQGYVNIHGVSRDPEGIWRAKAVKDDLALRVAIDSYGNVESQPDATGGVAQGSPSD